MRPAGPARSLPGQTAPAHRDSAWHSAERPQTLSHIRISNEIPRRACRREAPSERSAPQPAIVRARPTESRSGTFRSSMSPRHVPCFTTLCSRAIHPQARRALHPTGTTGCQRRIGEGNRTPVSPNSPPTSARRMPSPAAPRMLVLPRGSTEMAVALMVLRIGWRMNLTPSLAPQRDGVGCRERDQCSRCRMPVRGDVCGRFPAQSTGGEPRSGLPDRQPHAIHNCDSPQGRALRQGHHLLDPSGMCAEAGQGLAAGHRVDQNLAIVGCCQKRFASVGQPRRHKTADRLAVDAAADRGRSPRDLPAEQVAALIPRYDPARLTVRAEQSRQ